MANDYYIMVRYLLNLLNNIIASTHILKALVILMFSQRTKPP